MKSIKEFSLDDISHVKKIINQSDSILVGAGAGLSASAGLLYMDFNTFKNLFPGYHEKYGLEFIYQAAFFDFPTREEYFAYWARHIYKIRYEYPSGKPYKDLLTIINNKNYFVLTTNVDGQFLKSGFDEKKLCTPQGDYAFFQCSKPCNDTLYYNKEFVHKTISYLTDNNFSIKTEDIPYCPNCGNLLEPNLRKDNRFVETQWIKNYDLLNSFLENEQNKNLLLLELGVGFNTPGIIRYPFEQLVTHNKNIQMIRINLDNPEIHIKESGSKILTLQGDIQSILEKLL